MQEQMSLWADLLTSDSNVMRIDYLQRQIIIRLLPDLLPSQNQGANTKNVKQVANAGGEWTEFFTKTEFRKRINAIKKREVLSRNKLEYILKAGGDGQAYVKRGRQSFRFNLTHPEFSFLQLTNKELFDYK